MRKEISHSTYRIRARLLCHDVRLNTWIEVSASLDHAPDPAEAERLLWPEADQTVTRNACEDCPYELFDLQIAPLD